MRQDIVTCGCGQQNRIPVVLPAGKKVICAECKADLVDDDDDADDDDADDDADDDE